MATKLLDPVKKDLGITHSKKDDDIQDAILALIATGYSFTDDGDGNITVTFTEGGS